jgi:hypothetical protein
VRFLDDDTLCTAGADSALRLWDLSAALPAAAAGGAPAAGAPPWLEASATLRGHANEKHAAPLAAAPRGYLACGGEDNAAYVYHAATRAPALRHALGGGADALTGAPAPAPPGAFVSALAWRADGGALLAANSAGVIQLLRVVT